MRRLVPLVRGSPCGPYVVALVLFSPECRAAGVRRSSSTSSPAVARNLSPADSPLLSSGSTWARSNGGIAAVTTSSTQPRVLCWYKPNSVFDMEHVLDVLQEYNIPLECSFPVLASRNSSSHSTSTSTSGNSVADASGSSAAQSRPSTTGTVAWAAATCDAAPAAGGISAGRTSDGTVGTAAPECVTPTSSSSSSSGPAPAGSPPQAKRVSAVANQLPSASKHAPKHSPKHLEMIAFCTGRSATSTSTADDFTFANPRPTYFVFRDGSLVGWNCHWDELVWMRNALENPGAASSSAAKRSLKLDSQKQFAERRDEAQSIQRVSANRNNRDAGDAEEEGRLLLHHVGNKSSLFAAASALFSHDSLPSLATDDAATADFIAVESMRYQLFMKLPMAERPFDDTTGGPSYIDTMHDRIVLEDDAVVTKLPFSYALVQSVRLEALQTSLEPVATVVKQWQKGLSVDGKLQCSLKDLRRVKTRLLSLVEALNSGLNLSTTPRVFWGSDYNFLRHLHKDATEHLEIEDRTQSLRAQMETINETLSYLHDEVHAGVNEWLTLIIIILITAEISVALGILNACVHFVRIVLCLQ